MRRRKFLASSAALLSTLSGTAVAHEPFTPLGYADVGGTHDAVVEETTAYVAADDGFATVDVSEPTEPTVLAEKRDILSDIEDGPLPQIFDVAVEDDVLVVAGPANRKEDAFNGFGVYDVSDPAEPERTGVFRTEYPIHNLDIDDGIAYLTGNNGTDNPMVAVDVSGSPGEVGRWTLVDHDEQWSDVPGGFRTLHDIWVQDGTAYLAHWDAGTWIVDVSDPASMEGVAQVRGRSPGELRPSEVENQEYITLPGNDHYVTTNEDATLLGVGAEAWTIPGGDADGGPGGIELYDISTPTEPQQLAHIDPPATDNATYGGEWTTSHNFDIVGERLFSSWYRGGVRIHDVTDPANPVELVHWEDRDTAEFFTAKKVADRPFFVASSTKGGSGGYQVNSGLYTFPTVDEEGTPLIEGHSSSGTAPDATTTPEPTTSERTETTTGPEPTTEPETPSGEESETSTMDTEAGTTATETTTADGDGPGFGVLAALGGVLGGGWYARRRSREE